MLHLLPKKIPTLVDMLADIGNPSPAALAKALGLTERTIRKWKARNDAPKPVMLALFWITQWGQQWIDADLFNLAQVHMNFNQGLKQALAKEEKETARLRAQIEHLGQLGEFGSANDPVSGVTGPGPAPAEPMALTFTTFTERGSLPPAAEPVVQPRGLRAVQGSNRHARARRAAA